MNFKELLLNGQSFNEILKQFSIDQSDFIIKDEEVIFSGKYLVNKNSFKERILIEGKVANGFIRFFGILHCNLLNNLAVFELEGFERYGTLHAAGE